MRRSEAWLKVKFIGPGGKGSGWEAVASGGRLDEGVGFFSEGKW
jgi:hypothetical protein